MLTQIKFIYQPTSMVIIEILIYDYVKIEPKIWVLTTSSNLPFPFYWQPDNVKLRLFDLTEFLVWNRSLIKKRFVARTQFSSTVVLHNQLSLWNNIKYLNHNIFRTRCSKDIVIRKSKFVAKTQFLYCCIF